MSRDFRFGYKLFATITAFSCKFDKLDAKDNIYHRFKIKSI